MNRLSKIAMVFVGYVVACLFASAAVTIYQRFTQDSAAQASAGMYAFGDLLIFMAVFGILALLPTGMAVYFLFGKFPKR